MTDRVSGIKTISNIPAYLREAPEGIVLNLHVQPGSSCTAFVGLHGPFLKLKVKARPVDNAANKACQRFLAKQFNLPKSSVVLKSGHGSRQKSFLIPGVSLEVALTRFSGMEG